MPARYGMGRLIGHTGRTSRRHDHRTPRSRPLGAVERLEGRTLLSASGEWAFRLGGPSTDTVNCQAVDPAGDLYVTGSFTGKVDFDPADATGTDTAATLTSGGGGTDQDIFVAKYAPDGSFLWARHMGGSSGDNSGRGIAFAQDPVTGAQSVVVTGYFYGTADFSGTGAGGAAVRTSAGGADAFVEKMDANGNMLWVTTLGGTSNDMGRRVAVDGQGNAYVTGTFAGTASFGPSLKLTSAPSGGTSPTTDAFVARLDGSGNVVWAKGGGGPANDIAYWVAVGKSATGSTAVIVTGDIDDAGTKTSGQATFGPVSLPNTNEAGFVWELDAASGATNWAQEILPLSGGSSIAYGVATDSGGNIYVTGTFGGTDNFDGTVLTSYSTVGGGYSDNAFVEKLTPSGALTWVKTLGGSASRCDAWAASVDDLGDIYVTGVFIGVADFNPASPGTAVFASTPNNDNGFLCELDPTGAFLSAWNVGASSGSGTRAAVPYRDPVTGARSLYAAGTFSGTATLPTGDVLTSAGGTDVYVAKLNRQLGTLAGTVYNDLNDNGVNDDASPLAGWTVSLSQSQNGVFVPTGLSATTDAQGRYTFYNLAPGTYSVVASPPAGTSVYTQSAPAAGQPRVANLSAGQFTGGLDFGEFTPNQVKTYSNTTPVKLNGFFSTITSSITVPDSYPIYDLNVNFNMTLAVDGTISLTLKSPDGTAVQIAYGLRSTGSNFTNTTLDDAAATPLLAGAAPFTGSFRPANLLNAFNGKNVHGTWTLSQPSILSGNNVLNSWSLVVTGPKPGTASAMAMPAHSSPSVAIAPAATVPTPAPGPALPDVAGPTPGRAAGVAIRVPRPLNPLGLTPPSSRVAIGQTTDPPAAIVKVGGAVPVPSRVRSGSALSGTSRRPLASVW